MPRLRTVLATGAALFLIALGCFAYLWRTGRMQAWLQDKLVQEYVAKIAPHLPFTIEDLHVRGDFKDALHWSDWKISDLSAVLHWGQYRIRIEGPIEVVRDLKTNDLTAHFSPATTIETADGGERSTELTLKLLLRVGGLELKKSEKPHLEAISVDTEASRFAWKTYGVELEKPAFHAHWDVEKDWTAQVQARGENITLTLPKTSAGKDRMIHVPALEVEAQAPFALDPFLLGPEIEFRWSGKGGEMLLGDFYASVPLELLGAQGKVELGEEPRLDVRLGTRAAALHLDGTLRKRDGVPSAVEASWRTDALPLHELIEGIATSASIPTLRELAVKRGTLGVDGKASVPLHPHPSLLLDPRTRLSGTVRLNGVDARFDRARAAAAGLTLEAPFSLREGVHGSIQARKLYFRRLQASLGKTRFALNAVPDRGSGLKRRYDFSFAPEGGSTTSFLGLDIDGIPARIGAVGGYLDFSGESFAYDLNTELHLSRVPVTQVTRPLCVLVDHRLPPATVSADFSELEFSNGTIDPTGSASVSLFDGKIQASEIGLFDLGTQVPEVDFNLAFSDIRLDLLADWLGFGEMDGHLTGYANDVTFQGWLPTHYDFRLEAKPFHYNKVIFSPSAMRNLVGAVSGRDVIGDLPGAARFFASNALSAAKLLFGYDIWYGGLSLFSDEGSILLETLDPPSVVHDRRSSARLEEHYFLNGPRFKIPLKSSTYPVVVDATAMSNYVSGLYEYFHSLKPETPEWIREKEKQSETPCLPPDF